MGDEIERQLGALDDVLAPVRHVTQRLIDNTAIIDPGSGALLISHRAKVAPQAFAIVLYPGASGDSIARYETIHEDELHSSIPAVYKRVLSNLNGASLFEINLYGLPISMSQSPPLLNRSLRQPLDLDTANFHWSRGYKPAPALFHFGSGPFSFEENLGYFLNPDETVEARRVGGERFGHWDSLKQFLEVELKRAENLFPAFEKHQSEFRQQLGAAQQPRTRRKLR